MNFKNEIEKTKEVFNKKEHIFKRLKKCSVKGDFIGNYGLNDLNSVIYGYSVGFKNLYEPFLSRIINCISKGIEKKERFGSLDFHQYNLTTSLALANWIEKGIDNIELWKNASPWHEMLYDNNFPEKIGRNEKEILALRLVHYVHAKEYEKAIRLYRSIIGDKSFKLYENMSGYRIAYAYCLHFYENKFSVAQLEKSSKVFLEKELPMLYTKGRSREMLYWLKMICDAREKEYTPEEVIYTFYEYIPNEEKPDFVKELLGEVPKKKKSLFSFLKLKVLE